MPMRMPAAGVSVLRRASLWRAFRASKRSVTTLAIFESPARASCSSRSFATRSASAVASVDSDAFRANAARSPAASAASAAAEPASDASDDMMSMLEQSIAERQPSEALAYYNCLQSPPSGLTSQKLAILLAKQDSLHQARRAFEILQNVYGCPEFEVDDYTQLASIYIVDACLRQKLLPEALEIFDHAHKSDISLDLPAYDGLVRALVADDQIARAREVLMEIMAKRQVVLEQQTFQPLLLRLMERAEYDAVIDVIDHGRKHGVLFTFETYDPLVEMGELVDDSEDEDLWDELERFMAYINEALEEDGLTSLSDDEDEGDDVTVEVAYEDDDDDDDSDDFGEDFDDHKY